ncbi:MAG: hypothetical protein MJ085_03995 [Clostridia bacterium]|nr:hypothetical protein [Clostridia bacterium]
MKRRSKAGVIARCGLLGALAIVIMLMAGMIPAATFCCPVLVLFLMIPVISECGGKWAIVWYAAVCVLSFVLTFANPEATLIYLFLGYYPLLRKYINRLPFLPIRLATKLLLFNAAIAAAYSILLFVLKLPELISDLAETGKWMLLSGIAVANVCFFLTDYVLGRFEIYYAVKLRKKLKF